MMSPMKTSLATALALGLAATAAQAVPINITVDSSGNLLHTVGIADATQYDAAVGSLPTSNDPVDNLAFLDAMIGNWNGVPLAPVLPASGALALDQGSLTGNSYTGVSGYEYVVFHFGAGNAGGGGVSRGGYWVAYYLNGDALSFLAVPQVGGENVGGFSSARYYGVHTTGGGGGPSLPDGGSVLALLGLGLVVVGGARRMSTLA